MKNCKKCDKEFEPSKGLINYCSMKCRQGKKWTKEDKEKKSKAAKNSWDNNIYGPRIKIIEKVCLNCNKIYFSNKHNSIFCSFECSIKSDHRKESGRKAGLKSASIKIKRSKNEIYFYELCKEKFQNVENNKPIFNGWDADVIIHDLKIAILWNGKWHYEKITKKHSLKQVQNRDKIKKKEIENIGYQVYIIKDMGSFNEKFVNEQFEIFLLNS